MPSQEAIGVVEGRVQRHDEECTVPAWAVDGLEERNDMARMHSV